MDMRVMKLKHFFDKDVAEKLVAAGLDTPRKIKAADDKAIEAIAGIGAATRAAIKARVVDGEK